MVKDTAKIYKLLALIAIVQIKSIIGFDPEFYINKYPDVPKHPISAFLHYINHGFHKNRECAASFENTNFDWQYYIKINNLNILTEEEAINHYKNIGKLQNLEYCKKFKICVLFHLYNIELMPEFINKINDFIKRNQFNDFYIKINIPIGSNINKYSTINNNLEFNNDIFNEILIQTPYHKNLVNSKNYNALHNISKKLYESLNISKDKIQIIFSENRGADIGGTLLLFDQIIKEDLDIDYIVKIHTKTHYAWRQILISILNLKVNKLFNYYKYIDTCHFPVMAQPQDFDFMNKTLIKQFNLTHNKNFGFSGGTMFITSIEMVNFFKPYNLIDLFNQLNPNDIFHSKPGTKLEHAYERFFGYLSNYLNLKSKVIGYIK